MSITLVNIYVPNQDDPEFFNDLFIKLSKHECQNQIIAGDFNLVLDLEMDRKTGASVMTNNDKACNVLEQYMETFM